jgi:hypothetical protein
VDHLFVFPYGLEIRDHLVAVEVFSFLRIHVYPIHLQWVFWNMYIFTTMLEHISLLVAVFFSTCLGH